MIEKENQMPHFIDGGGGGRLKSLPTHKTNSFQMDADGNFKSINGVLKRKHQQNNINYKGGQIKSCYSSKDTKIRHRAKKGLQSGIHKELFKIQ